VASPRTDHARRLFAGIAGEYDRMGAAMSFGQDGRWRRFLSDRVPRGALVLDVATGTGLVARELVRRRGASVVGVDQSGEMLRSGRSSRTWPVVQGQAEGLPFPDGTFGALTFTYLLRYVDDPAATMAELARVVRPGGVVASLEFHVPRSAPVRLAWRGYTRLGLPAIGRVASREWAATGRFLGPSIEEHWRRYPAEVQSGWWSGAGLVEVRAQVMSLGGGIVTWGRKDG
jgi:demethylmenaquinone methyltransferase/2-methoxy-6-polyprenyl-1,4-benzoquinol methylase